MSNRQSTAPLTMSLIIGTIGYALTRLAPGERRASSAVCGRRTVSQRCKHVAALRRAGLLDSDPNEPPF